ncbi:MAG: phosphate/phosphite/phosphonate ABC transporter substrate-binding protein [Deltaproteobacteria bacterium]|nr:MAG: phosphate/phosphite/phosphonate ABC transporter substrate-binding protein [Deltaproteobacteria bacterium]
MAGKDHPRGLEGYALQSTAGFSPRFVHAMSAPLKDAKVIDSPAVLSGLRRAANGERLAVLLDGPQAQALSTLPFAQGLAPLSTSAPVPVALVATVGKRLDERKWKAVQTALLSLAGDASAREALDGVRMTAFVALDRAALSTARAAYEKAR